MNNGVNEQVLLFLTAVIIGLLLGAVNDVFRFLRFLGFVNKRSVFIQDVVFMGICGIVVFLYSLAFNLGEIRFFTILASLIGVLLYRYTIGIITGMLFSFIASVLSKVKKILAIIWHYNVRLVVIILKPIYNLKNIFSKIQIKKEKSLAK